jgi:hypothetical protein
MQTTLAVTAVTMMTFAPQGLAPLDCGAKAWERLWTPPRFALSVGRKATLLNGKH